MYRTDKHFNASGVTSEGRNTDQRHQPQAPASRPLGRKPTAHPTGGRAERQSFERSHGNAQVIRAPKPLRGAATHLSGPSEDTSEGVRDPRRQVGLFSPADPDWRPPTGFDPREPEVSSEDDENTAHDRDSENEEEESDVSDSETAPANRTSTNRPKPTAVPSTPSKQRTSAIPPYLTPTHKRQPPAPETSSPVPAPNQRDYSSDLSSPFPTAKRMRMGSDEEDEEGPMRKVKRKTDGPARTREYETVAVVRRKIVFAL
ncbi:hypothetical protein NCC49_004697, partial [Naganishia albida]